MLINDSAKSSCVIPGASAGRATTTFVLFHSAQCHSVSANTQDHFYSINATHSISYDSMQLTHRNGADSTQRYSMHCNVASSCNLCNIMQLIGHVRVFPKPKMSLFVLKLVIEPSIIHRPWLRSKAM